ncbi:hypothetical protein D9756_001994 [Leucocoprinus leucothites]|uniref:Uncharacterized protein n=1 Tax=Leucocoprinus leucothites TaxID=201217 RepID=A0A8H5GC88_9AGAR|nr:hypothetical protein D9756_001994 [Leucoagaricus leucothites]
MQPQSTHGQLSGWAIDNDNPLILRNWLRWKQVIVMLGMWIPKSGRQVEWDLGDGWRWTLGLTIISLNFQPSFAQLSISSARPMDLPYPHSLLPASVPYISELQRDTKHTTTPHPNQHSQLPLRALGPFNFSSPPAFLQRLGQGILATSSEARRQPCLASPTHGLVLRPVWSSAHYWRSQRPGGGSSCLRSMKRLPNCRESLARQLSESDFGYSGYYPCVIPNIPFCHTQYPSFGHVGHVLKPFSPLTNHRAQSPLWEYSRELSRDVTRQFPTQNPVTVIWHSLGATGCIHSSHMTDGILQFPSTNQENTS